MTDHNNTTDGTQNHTTDASNACHSRHDGRHRGHGRRLVKLTVFGLIVGAFAYKGAAMAGFGGHGCHGAHDPQQRTERMIRHVTHVLDHVDATDEQLAQIEPMVATVAQQMQPAHNLKMQLMEDALATLSAEQVDAAELERIRAEAVAQFDATSRTIVEQFAAAANVLETDQRAELVDWAKERHERMAERHRKHKQHQRDSDD